MLRSVRGLLLPGQRGKVVRLRVLVRISGKAVPGLELWVRVLVVVGLADGAVEAGGAVEEDVRWRSGFGFGVPDLPVALVSVEGGRSWEGVGLIGGRLVCVLGGIREGERMRWCCDGPTLALFLRLRASLM